MAACPRLCTAQETILFSSFKAMPPAVGTMPLNIMILKTGQKYYLFFRFFTLFWQNLSDGKSKLYVTNNCVATELHYSTEWDAYSLNWDLQLLLPRVLRWFPGIFRKNCWEKQNKILLFFCSSPLIFVVVNQLIGKFVFLFFLKKVVPGVV